MKTPLPIADKTIAKLIADRFGVPIIDLEFIPEGEMSWLYSAQNSATGDRLVVKIQQKPPKLPGDIYAALAKAGFQWMPQPTLTTTGKLWARDKQRSYSLQQYIAPGPDSHIFQLDDRYLASLGQVLRELHELHLPSSLTARIGRETYVPRRHKSVEAFVKKMEKSRLKKHRELKLACLENRELIARFQQDVLAKGKELQKLSLPMVLVHGDVHPFNILRPNQQVYLTDWETCRMAQPENDFMYFDDRQLALMSQGYGRDLLANRVAIEYHRMYLKVRELYFFGDFLGYQGTTQKIRQRGLRSFQELCRDIAETYTYE